MQAVNLGSRGLSDACNLLEYCNHKSGTMYSDLRIQHGYKEPHNIKLWCLGNEMDGSWQIGHKTAENYGLLANETAKAMKIIDPSIELVLCGSSFMGMSTFATWEDTALGIAYNSVDYLSMHQYYGNDLADTENFLAKSDAMDSFIKTIRSTLNFIKARKHSKKDIGISFDEWNVWFHSSENDDEYLEKNPWQEAPPILEDHYTFEDAVLVGLMLITLIKNSDSVKIACLAQLVNVIAPIMTVTGGAAWRQTIYYPFLQASVFGRGKVIMPVSSSTKHDTKEFTDVTDVDSVAVFDEENSAITVFFSNRVMNENVEFSVSMKGFEGYKLDEYTVMEGHDVNAVNSECGELVAPVTATDRVEQNGNVYSVVLKGISWNVMRFKKQ